MYWAQFNKLEKSNIIKSERTSVEIIKNKNKWNGKQNKIKKIKSWLVGFWGLGAK